MNSRIWSVSRILVLVVGYWSILFILLATMIKDSVTYSRGYPSPDGNRVAVAVNYAGGGAIAPSAWSELRVVGSPASRWMLSDEYAGRSLLSGEYDWFTNESDYTPLLVRWARPGLLFVESKAK